MKRTLTHAAALGFALSLLACGESHLIQESDKPTLRQHIFVLPDRYAGPPYNYGQAVTTVYLDTNESVKFWAAYTLDGTYITPDASEDHYLNHAWTIEGEEYNISPLRFKFSTPGYRQGVLQTVDLMGDTLRDTVNIYVNTPLSIQLVAPSDGYNQASPINSEIDIRWEISGIDPWEDSRCNVFASFSKDSVWDHNLGKVDCIEGSRLVGSFISDSLYQYIQKHPEADTSATIYWGVKARLYTNDGFEERDSTSIFHFTTLYLHGDSARVSIPITFEKLPSSTPVFTKVVLTSSTGDTLDMLTSNKAETTLSANVPAQTDINIYITEQKRTEYQQEHIVVTTSPKAKTQVDTVRMKDNVQPQVALLERPLTGNDSLIFYALDQGSGINPNRIHVVMGYDTLEFKYDEPFVAFKNTCIGECFVRVSVEDFARNTSPKVFWKIYNKDSLSISGPYTELWEGL